MSACSTDECRRPASIKGRCRSCYYRVLHSVNPDELAVTCWCENQIVPVPADDVAAGRTRSCGLPHCNERVMVCR